MQKDTVPTKENPLICVIVLCYNTEKYIAGCLDSLLNQTYNNWIAYCIDDCSSDNSLNILKKYEKIDSRIKVFKSKKNQGISKNRNFAISMIEPNINTWIYSIDSDDYISPYMFEYIVNSIEKAPVNCQFIKLNFQRTNLLYKENDSVNESIDTLKPIFQTWTRDEYFTKCDVGGYTCSTFANSALIKENDICYPENQFILEDQVYAIKAMAFSENIMTIDVPFYYYYFNPTSNGSTLGNKRPNDIYHCINELYPVLFGVSESTRHFLKTDFMPHRINIILTQLIHATRSINPSIRLNNNIKIWKHLKYGVKSPINVSPIKLTIKYIYCLLIGKGKYLK